MGLVVSTILHLAELHNAERFVVVTSHSALLELTFSSVLKICSSNLPQPSCGRYSFVFSVIPHFGTSGNLQPFSSGKLLFFQTLGVQKALKKVLQNFYTKGLSIIPHRVTQRATGASALEGPHQKEKIFSLCMCEFGLDRSFFFLMWCVSSAICNLRL